MQRCILHCVDVKGVSPSHRMRSNIFKTALSARHFRLANFTFVTRARWKASKCIVKLMNLKEFCNSNITSTWSILVMRALAYRIKQAVLAVRKLVHATVPCSSSGSLYWAQFIHQKLPVSEVSTILNPEPVCVGHPLWRSSSLFFALSIETKLSVCVMRHSLLFHHHLRRGSSLHLDSARIKLIPHLLF